MNKKIRLSLFLIISVCFVFASIFFVLYTQGLKFDFSQKKFVRTGGIFVNVENPNSKIYLNNNLVAKNSIIKNSTFIKNLLPKKYLIKIDKNGFFPWQKDLKVEEGKVTEVQNITLFKKNPYFKQLTGNILDFYPSQKGGFLLLRKNANQLWLVSIFDPKMNTFQDIFSAKNLNLISQPMIKEWDPERKIILCQEKQNNKGENIFFIVNYKEFPKVYISQLNFKNEIKKIALNPIDENSIIFLEDDKIFILNFAEKTETNPEKTNFPTSTSIYLALAEPIKSTPINSDAVWFYKTNTDLYYLNSAGFILKESLPSLNKQILNNYPINLGQEKKFEIRTCANNLFLKLGNSVYLLDKNNKFSQIISGVKKMIPSPNNNRLAFQREKEILFWNGNKESQRLTFLARFSVPVKFLSWINPYYLIFTLNNEIKITETDNRDKVNIITVKTLPNPKIFFSQKDKKIYALSNNLFFSSEKITGNSIFTSFNF